MKFALQLGLLVAALGLFAACSDGENGDKALDAAPTAGVTAVSVQGMKYGPRVIEVPADTAVTWTFADGGTPHDVRGDGFKSETMKRGTFTHTFDEPGTYDYRCSLHGNMTGRVIVTG